MTDAEKQALSARIAAAAEAHGLPGELVWERAWECPAGHVMTGRAPNDTCIYYDEAARQVCGRDVRHSRIALDLTNPTYLFPLIEEYYRGKPVTIELAPNIYDGWVSTIKPFEKRSHHAVEHGIADGLAEAFEAALQWEATHD